MECADVLDMQDDVNEENEQQMIEMGNSGKMGYVDLDSFMKIMYQIGLI